MAQLPAQWCFSARVVLFSQSAMARPTNFIDGTLDGQREPMVNLKDFSSARLFRRARRGVEHHRQRFHMVRLDVAVDEEAFSVLRDIVGIKIGI